MMMNHQTTQRTILMRKILQMVNGAGLDNSRTSQLGNSKFLKIMELLYLICTLNLTLTITVTLSILTAYKSCNLSKITLRAIILQIINQRFRRVD